MTADRQAQESRRPSARSAAGRRRFARHDPALPLAERFRPAFYVLDERRPAAGASGELPGPTTAKEV